MAYRSLAMAYRSMSYSRGVDNFFEVGGAIVLV